MLGKRSIRRILHSLRRIRTHREYLVFIVFMCFTLYLSTYLFHFSSVLNENLPWNTASNRDSNSVLSNNYYYVLQNSKQSMRPKDKGSGFRKVDYSPSESVDHRNGGYKLLLQRVEALLYEIENVSIHSSKSNKAKAALIRGQRSVISRDFPLYKWAFEKHGYFVDEPHIFRSNKKLSSVDQYTTNASDWFVLICLDFSDADTGLCFEKRDLLNLKPYQKVNRLPGMKNLMGRKDAFCSTMNEVRKISILLRHPLTPLCFVFPQQYQQFIDVADALGYSAEWILKPVTVGGRLSGSGPQKVTIFTNEGREKVKEYSTKRAVVQQLISNPLLINGSPINLRVYVLITSIAPLRAYVHSEGLVYHRFDSSKNYKKITGRTWMLSYFWQFVAKQFGNSSVKKAMKSIHRTLVQILLVAEAMLVTQSNLREESNAIGDEWTIIKRCTTCFQLIAVDLMLNSTFDPFVLEVSSQPNMQEASKDELFVMNKVKKVVLDDFVNIITASTKVASQVTDALEEVLLENSVGVMGISCLISHEMCLSRNDLEFLIQTRKEALNRGKFRRLYPDFGTEIHKELIDELSTKIIGNSVNNDLSFHKTADLHPLIMALERYYNRHVRYESNSYANNNQNINNSLKFKNILDCSEDTSTLPLLSAIELQPKLNLSPPFSPHINQYYANASYDQLLITVFARTQNCQSEVRIDDKYGPSRPTKYTLGIGLNKVTFVVVDISHTEPWVISSYTLHINRLHLKHNESQFNALQTHEICSLKQDCDLRVFAREACGLQRENGHDWRKHLKIRSLMPSCESGTSTGKWVLPCNNCDHKWTCYWSEARWEPDRCQHKLLSSETVAKCLANRKILFVGDSTNRGIMHYLIERLNGSLTDSDKTHNIRLYSDLNHGRTMIGFTYYPKFWLPSSQRPPFDKTFLQLLERVQPFENSSNIVIMFGGVQWLAVQHIHMLLTTLSNLKLKDVKLVMKTLGAGFHQPIQGVHCLSLEEQQKLSAHNTGLSVYAASHGIEVIDTFNITVARFKDYYPGKCACHFHSITDIQSKSMSSSSSSTSEQRYHVEGFVNAAYSEIFISRLCSER